MFQSLYYYLMDIVNIKILSLSLNCIIVACCRGKEGCFFSKGRNILCALWSSILCMFGRFLVFDLTYLIHVKQPIGSVLEQ